MAMTKADSINTRIVLKMLKENNSTLSVKPLNGEARKRFMEKVNAHRPYCSSDFKKQHFIPDLSYI